MTEAFLVFLTDERGNKEMEIAINFWPILFNRVYIILLSLPVLSLVCFILNTNTWAEIPV